MAVGKFRLPPHVDHDQVLIKRKINGQFIRLYVDDHVDWFTGLPPGGEAPVQVTFYLVKTNPREPHDAFTLLARRGHQQDRFIKRKQTSCPLGKAAVEPNAYSAWYKTFDKAFRVPRVQQYYASLFQPMRESSQIECLQAGLEYIVQTLITFLIDPGI